MESKITKSQMNFWLKELDNGHKVFDYQKMWDDEAFFFILISERGKKGKTYGAIEFARDMYLKNDIPSFYFKNLSIQMEKSYKKIITMPKRNNPEKYENSISTKEEVYDNIPVEWDKNDKVVKSKKYPWLFLHSLNEAEKVKGARSIVNMGIWDEASDGLEYIKDQMGKFDTILNTYKNHSVSYKDDSFKKMFILTNFKSLNLEFLIAMGVYKIDKPVTTVRGPNGKILLRILTVMYDDNEIEEMEKEYKDDPIFQMGKVLETNDYSVFNKNMYDDINNVVMETDFKLYVRHFVIYGNNRYFHLFKRIDYSNHIISTKHYTGPNNIYVLDKKDIKEGYQKISKDFKYNMTKLLQQNRLTFQDVATREKFLQILLK